MPKPPDLQQLRESIESVDRELLEKLRERMELADVIASAKIAAASPFRDQQREDRVLQQVRRMAADLGMDAHEVERLYRLIMEMSVARQQETVHSLPTVPLRVAYQGVEGSYSHLAAQVQYARREGGVLLIACESFRQAAESVESGECDLALLPIENTSAGSINETYDLLVGCDVTITGEVIAEIEHCLLAIPGAKILGIERVLSHPQGLAQCEEFLRGMPWAKPQAEFDTAGAARKVRERGDPTIAAIASATAARVYGLEILAQGIQTSEGNYTRFVEIGREAVPCPPDAACKTSLCLVLGHEPGDLGKVLIEFGRRGVNLSKLESRPLPDSPFRYRFYMDLEGHAASEPVVAVLEAIEPLTEEIRLLGTYPRADGAQG